MSGLRHANWPRGQSFVYSTDNDGDSLDGFPDAVADRPGLVPAPRPQLPLEAAASVTTGSTPEDLAVRRSDLDRLGALLATLAGRDRELVALKYGVGLTNRAIAGITGLSESNVGTLLHRVVQDLRARW